LTDAQALSTTGQTQQQLAQTGLDTAYTNATNANQAPWTTLNNLKTAISGVSVPTTSSTAINSPTSSYAPGALQQFGQLYGLLRAGS
jgi:hypothetical protein